MNRSRSLTLLLRLCANILCSRLICTSATAILMQVAVVVVVVMVVVVVVVVVVLVAAATVVVVVVMWLPSQRNVAKCFEPSLVPFWLFRIHTL